MAKAYDETAFSTPKIGDTLCNSLLQTLQVLVEDMTGSRYNDFRCTQYSEQPTYGTNYKAKVPTGNDEYVHLHFYKPPSERAVQLNFIELAKSASDPLNDVYHTKYFNKYD